MPWAAMVGAKALAACVIGTDAARHQQQLASNPTRQGLEVSTHTLVAHKWEGSNRSVPNRGPHEEGTDTPLQARKVRQRGVKVDQSSQQSVAYTAGHRGRAPTRRCRCRGDADKGSKAE